MNCPICNDNMKLLFTVSFRYSLSGMADYFQCISCGYIKAPLFDNWTEKAWKQIYNEKYHLVDTGAKVRQYRYANMINTYFFDYHLDYGSGEGLVSKILSQSGRNSYSYDPFYKNDKELPNIKFDFVSAIEVLEHLTNPNMLFKQIDDMTYINCKMLATTKLSSSFTKPIEKFWYVNPYAGHICFYTDKSLQILAENNGWKKIDTKNDNHFFIKIK